MILKSTLLLKLEMWSIPILFHDLWLTNEYCLPVYYYNDYITVMIIVVCYHKISFNYL